MCTFVPSRCLVSSIERRAAKSAGERFLSISKLLECAFVLLRDKPSISNIFTLKTRPTSVFVPVHDRIVTYVLDHDPPYYETNHGAFLLFDQIAYLRKSFMSAFAF